MPNLKIKILACGGTIDKEYFDAKSEYKVGEPQIAAVLRDSIVTFDFAVKSVMQKDSLEITDADRQKIRAAAEACSESHIIVTHGTDTMVETAKALQGIPGKTIVLTGSLQPAKFRVTDAVFNIGCAIGAVQSFAPGVYIAMNGNVFNPDHVRKNVTANRFEAI